MSIPHGTCWLLGATLGNQEAKKGIERDLWCRFEPAGDGEHLKVSDVGGIRLLPRLISLAKVRSPDPVSLHAACRKFSRRITQLWDGLGPFQLVSF